MKRLIFAGLAAVLCAQAAGQAVHHGYVWLEGPEGVLAPNTTYTMEAWGRWESPLFIDGFSAMAGFGFDVINTAGSGTQVASVSNVQFFLWDGLWGTQGTIVGTNITGISGGQIPNPGIVPIWPFMDLRNPIPLFTFTFITADAPIVHLGFEPMRPHPMGGLSFYPNATDGASIIAPNDEGTALHMIGWEYVVPSPSSWVAVGLMMLAGRRGR